MQTQLMEVLQRYWQQLLMLLPKIALAIAVFVIALFIARRLRNLVAKKALARLEDPLLAKFLSKVTKWVIVLIALTIAFHIVELSKIAGSILAGAGVSAIVFGFAFKDIGENFLAGIILAFKRPFRVGDTVETGDIKGTIKTLDIRYTHIRSFDGKDIYVPNGMILKNPLYNCTKDGLLRFDFTVGINYDKDADEARQIILDNIIDKEGVLKEPVPIVFVEEIKKGKIIFRVFYWINIKKYKGSVLELKTDILNQTKKILLERGFDLPADILELKIHNEEYPIPIRLLNMPPKNS